MKPTPTAAAVPSTRHPFHRAVEEARSPDAPPMIREHSYRDGECLSVEAMSEIAKKLDPSIGPTGPIMQDAPADSPHTPRWGVVPTPEELVPFICGAAGAVLDRVQAAGLKYGEDVLFMGGELVSAAQVFTDACRILYGVKEDPGGECERDDSWLDLAGYALIELARRAYERGDPPGAIDGLFDR